MSSALKALIPSAAGLGVMLYPMQLQRKAKENFAAGMAVAPPMEFNSEIRNLIRTGEVTLITDFPRFIEWANTHIKSNAKKQAAYAAASLTLGSNLDAELIYSDIGGAAVVASPQVAKTSLAAKEFGKYLENIREKPLLSALQGSLVGGSHTRDYKDRARAWDRVGIDQDDQLRKLDMQNTAKTYGAFQGIPASVIVSKITRHLLNKI